jgi:hypothetical protein
MAEHPSMSSFLAHRYELVRLLDMKEFNYRTLCTMLSVLSFHGNMTRSEDAVDVDDRETLRLVQTTLHDMDLKSSLKLAKRLPTEFQDNNRTKRELSDRIKVLDERIRDDLDELTFLYVPNDRKDYYENSRLFGQLVAVNFSNANYDIEEAGKSFALDRYTACVMHLMRSLEVALDAVGIAVGLPDTVVEAHASWESLLKKIDTQITGNDKSAIPDWPLKRQFFVDARAHLFSVKNAWRNPSMHLEKKYTEREAERIFRAVRDFMEHLATHLDQAGNFTP